MRNDLTRRYLFSGGEPILSLAEFQSYAYGLPEGTEAPAILSGWAAGQDIAPTELLRCFRNEGTAVAASSDESLEIARLALERLQTAFPGHSGSE